MNSTLDINGNEVKEKIIPITLENSTSIEQSETIQIPVQTMRFDRFDKLGIVPNSPDNQLAGNLPESVQFEIENQIFECSRAFLSEKSPLFAALFELKPNSGYTLSTIDGIVFGILLDFLHTGKIGDELELHAIKLLEMSHNFEIENLQNICEDFLENNLKLDQIIDIFLLADKINCHRLKQKAMQYIAVHCPSLVDSGPDFDRIIRYRPQLSLELFRYVKHICEQNTV